MCVIFHARIEVLVLDALACQPINPREPAPAGLPHSATREGPVPLASTLLPLRQDVRHVLLHGRRRRPRRPDQRARFPEDHRLRDGWPRRPRSRLRPRARVLRHGRARCHRPVRAAIASESRERSIAGDRSRPRSRRSPRVAARVPGAPPYPLHRGSKHARHRVEAFARVRHPSRSSRRVRVRVRVRVSDTVSRFRDVKRRDPPPPPRERPTDRLTD